MRGGCHVSHPALVPATVLLQRGPKLGSSPPDMGGERGITNKDKKPQPLGQLPRGREVQGQQVDFGPPGRTALPAGKTVLPSGPPALGLSSLARALGLGALHSTTQGRWRSTFEPSS